MNHTHSEIVHINKAQKDNYLPSKYSENTTSYSGPYFHNSRPKPIGELLEEYQDG
jgi:hypothetical protein